MTLYTAGRGRILGVRASNGGERGAAELRML